MFCGRSRIPTAGWGRTLVIVAAAAGLAGGGAACRLADSIPPQEPGREATVEGPASARRGDGEPSTPYFSGPAALARVEQLLGWPRALGDPRRDRSIDALEQMLRKAGAQQVTRQPFSAEDPATGDRYALVNLYGHVRPEAPRRFVLATHFDTRPWADEEDDPDAHHQPVPGANDGTSGVAVLLELLPELADALPEDVGLTVILFDGEELGRPKLGGYCMGSRYFEDAARSDPPSWLAGAEAGIVLDMVGDRDLHLPIEPGSAAQAPALVERIWEVAHRRGHAQFEDQPRPVGIFDDHVPLHRAGVPSVLLIDKEYEPWHTRRDTIDQVSAESLAAVGDTVLYTVLDLVERPLPRP